MSAEHESDSPPRKRGRPSKKSLEEKIEKTKTRSKSYALDLRVHSPVSPSGLGYMGVEGLDPAPALVSLAKAKKLDVIAMTDFYSGAFIDRVITAARGSPLVIIPGVDIRVKVGRCDDIIISCLFPETYTSGTVEEFLRELGVPKSAEGDRSYKVPLPFTEVLKLIEKHGGLALPSRVDKTPHRLEALPVLVEEYGFRVFDLAYTESTRIFNEKWPDFKFQLYSFSNASSLAQVGSRIAKVKLAHPNFENIKSLMSREHSEEEQEGHQHH